MFFENLAIAFAPLYILICCILLNRRILCNHFTVATDLQSCHRFLCNLKIPIVQKFGGRVGNNVTRKGITCDLEALYKEAIRSVLLFTTGDWLRGSKNSPAITIAEDVYALFRYAGLEASRFGMNIKIHNALAWTGRSGSWIPVFTGRVVYKCGFEGRISGDTGIRTYWAG